MQLKPRGSFSQDMLNADVEAIKEAYNRIGRDDTQVTTQIMDLGENRVNVVFEINEGGRTKISAVNFNGNNAYSDRRLARDDLDQALDDPVIFPAQRHLCRGPAAGR